MRKKTWLWLVVILLLIAALTSYLTNRATADLVLGKKIEELAKSGETAITLPPLTDFDWDQAMVYGPYTTKDVIEESLKITFKGDTHGIELLEDRFLLVFAKGKYAVRTVPLSRIPGNYHMAPGDDVLVVTH